MIQRELDAHLGPRPTYPRDAYGFSATIASSSRAPDAMAIVPRLMETLLAVAHPYSVDLFVHCANVMLRLGRLLVLVPREMPFSLFAIEIMQAVKQAGAVSLPPVVAYYLKSRTLEQLTDSFVGRILKMLRMEHTPYRRWREVDSMSWT